MDTLADNQQRLSKVREALLALMTRPLAGAVRVLVLSSGRGHWAWLAGTRLIGHTSHRHS